MNNKLNKLQMEIDKIKQKITEQQAKLRELEQQKTEIENTEIVFTISPITAYMIATVLHAAAPPPAILTN